MKNKNNPLPCFDEKKYRTVEFFKNLIWLNTNEAAEYLRVSPGNLRVLIYRGVLIPYKLRNRNRFKREELDRLIESSLTRR